MHTNSNTYSKYVLLGWVCLGWNRVDEKFLRENGKKIFLECVWMGVKERK